jgi:hypothetical protein
MDEPSCNKLRTDIAYILERLDKLTEKYLLLQEDFEERWDCLSDQIHKIEDPDYED